MFVNRAPEVLTAGGPNMPQTNLIWRTAAILKIQKIAISPQWKDRFWWNLVQLCVWALKQTPTANNISQIWKSKMAADAILKTRKILTSSQPIDWFWQNLARRCISILWILITNNIKRFQKFKMAAPAILKIRKIAISPQRNNWFIKTNFVLLCVWALQTPSDNKISQI